MSDKQPDPVWERIRAETEKHAQEEPVLASFLHATILNHDSLECALSFHLASQLDSPTVSSLLLREVILKAMRSDKSIGQAIRCDLLAVVDPEVEDLCRATRLDGFVDQIDLVGGVLATGHWSDGCAGGSLEAQAAGFAGPGFRTSREDEVADAIVFDPIALVEREGEVVLV